MRPPARIRRSAAILFSPLKPSSDKSGSNTRSSRFTMPNKPSTASRYSLRVVISVRWGSGGVSISAMPLSDQQPAMKIPAVKPAEKRTRRSRAGCGPPRPVRASEQEQLGRDILARRQAKKTGRRYDAREGRNGPPHEQWLFLPVLRQEPRRREATQ